MAFGTRFEPRPGLMRFGILVRPLTRPGWRSYTWLAFHTARGCHIRPPTGRVARHDDCTEIRCYPEPSDRCARLRRSPEVCGV